MHIFRNLPIDVINNILSYDDRIIIRKGSIVFSCKFNYTPCYNMLDTMFQERRQYEHKYCYDLRFYYVNKSYMNNIIHDLDQEINNLDEEIKMIKAELHRRNFLELPF